MITVFNRKELLCTLSVKAQADAGNRLQEAGIDYVIDTKDMTGRSSMHRGAGMGRFGENPEVGCEYRVFVHREDFERAKNVLNGAG